MSFEPRDYLRHIAAEADYLIEHSSSLMAGMRDRLIHDYFGVDYDLVWDVVRNRMPALRVQIAAIFET